MTSTVSCRICAIASRRGRVSSVSPFSVGSPVGPLSLDSAENSSDVVRDSSPSCAVESSDRGSWALRAVFGAELGTTFVPPAWLAETLRQLEPQAAEQDPLELVRHRHAAKLNAPAGGGRQHDVVELDAGDLLEHGARSMAQGAASHPLLERLPQDVGEEREQDVRLHSILPPVPHGP